MPEWLSRMIADLELRVAASKIVADAASAKAEQARQASVRPQQQLSKLQDALDDLNRCAAWFDSEEQK